MEDLKFDEWHLLFEGKYEIHGYLARSGKSIIGSLGMWMVLQNQPDEKKC